MKRFLVGAMMIALVCSLLANALLYLRYAGGRPLITMGKTVITRQEYRDALEQQSGKAVLRKLVLARLVEREARTAGVLPTQSDVDTRLSEIERTMPTVVQEARLDATRLYNLRNDIFTDIALERLRVRGVPVTDNEVAAYYREHRTQFVRPMQVETTAVVAQNSADASTAAELLQQNMKPYVIARQARLRVIGVDGFQPDFSTLPPAEVSRMQAVMARTRPGQIATVPIGNAFLVFQMKSRQKQEALAFDAARADATRLARLAKAPASTDYLLRLYQKAQPVFEANQYAEYFREFAESTTPSTPSDEPRKMVQTARR